MKQEISIVSSSRMNRAEYDDETSMMYITFGSKTYNFYNVPNTIWEEFKNAPSKGKYFISNIKGKYSGDFKKK